MKLLHLDSSALGTNSATRRLTAAIVERQRALDPSLDVVYRDLDAAPLPHLSFATEVDAGSGVLEEFLAADSIVIGAPMYNFGIPSVLKAWIDRIAVAGRTFRYGPDGPVGLVGGKQVLVAIAAGGEHAGQPADFVEPYLRHVFAFLGVHDVRVVRADGLSRSPAHRERVLDAALATLREPLPHVA